MKIIYTKLLTVKVLKKYAKILNIRNHSKLNKKNLITTLNIHKNVSYIQRTFRKKTMVDSICPISFETLKYPFAVIKTNSKFKYYDLKTLVDYLKDSRDFRDPSTRIEIQDEKVKELNRLMGYYYKQKNTDNLWTVSMVNRTEFITISSCINQIFSEILQMEIITINFIYSVFIPQMIYYFHYLIKKHKNECKGILQECITRLETHECGNKFFILDYLNLMITINEL